MFSPLFSFFSLKFPRNLSLSDRFFSHENVFFPQAQVRTKLMFENYQNMAYTLPRVSIIVIDFFILKLLPLDSNYTPNFRT